MPVKIRLQRHGKKGKPFYWVVAADARAKRDGRYLEKLGTYNPNSNPATVDLNIDHAVSWLEKGAQPTDTARTLLSYKGVMLKHHLNGGVRKGALTQEQADTKFAAWLEEKETKIQAKKDGLTQAESDARAKRLADEKAVSDKRLADAAAAEAEVEAAEAAEAAAEAEATEATEAVEEAAAEETTEAVAEEAPAAEATEEEAAPEANEASEEKEG
ncbi:30S ribosomal protein S16 [Flavobacteriaceae bacterium]|jgi:small subunit ribosomal protein S16|nr:30S ribosomal protein S16 [Flavobacteriaceae bacterium]